MGQTFGRVYESKEKTDLYERTKMYADFLWLIKLTEELKGQRYLYLVKPVDNETDGQNDQFEEVNNRITSVISQNFTHTNDEIDVLR